jgi:hypothetical protein
MLYGRHWRLYSGTLALLLVELWLAPYAHVTASQAPATTQETATLSLTAVPAHVMCCCKPGRCHMPNCPMNPDYWKTHRTSSVLASCDCSISSSPVALTPGTGHRLLPILLTVDVLCRTTLASSNLFGEFPPSRPLTIPLETIETPPKTI